jgi:hypothetical protein
VNPSAKTPLPPATDGDLSGRKIAYDREEKAMGMIPIHTLLPVTGAPAGDDGGAEKRREEGEGGVRAWRGRSSFNE